MPHITVSIEQQVMVLTINRPEKKNALTQAMYKELSAALKQLDADDSLKVCVIHGQGGAFTAGNDLHDFIQAKSPDDLKDVKTFLHDIGKVNKPLLAAIEGPAVGIGSTLLPHCDLVYASKDAYFSMPFVNLGICVEAGNSVLLPRLVGYHHACELLLLGEAISAQRAAEIGLINQVVEQDVISSTMAKAKLIAQKPVDALLATKRLLKQNAQYDHDRTIEQENKLLFELLYSDSTKQIIQSFFSKEG